MLRLELDWVTEVAPLPLGPDMPEGVPSGIVVELVQEHGPGGGWPVIAVFAPDGPILWAWLRNVYLEGLDPEDASEQASEFADSAEKV